MDERYSDIIELSNGRSIQHIFERAWREERTDTGNREICVVRDLIWNLSGENEEPHT